MTKGTKLIYGANDKEHAIKCAYTGKWELIDGITVIYAVCDNGGTIKAPIEMFKEA